MTKREMGRRDASNHVSMRCLGFGCRESVRANACVRSNSFRSSITARLLRAKPRLLRVFALRRCSDTPRNFFEATKIHPRFLEVCDRCGAPPVVLPTQPRIERCGAYFRAMRCRHPQGSCEIQVRDALRTTQRVPRGKPCSTQR